MDRYNPNEVYQNSVLNNALYGAETKTKLEDYFLSIRYYLTKEHLRPGDHILDVGGASGELLAAIENEVCPIQGTVIDPNRISLDMGRQSHPEFEFVEGIYPADLPADGKYDVLLMNALFPQIPDWKSMLLAMAKTTKRLANFSLGIKLAF